MFYELVRLLLGMGDRAAAEGIAICPTPGRAPATKAFAVAIEGLLEDDATRAAELLRDAAAEFERAGDADRAGSSVDRPGRGADPGRR